MEVTNIGDYVVSIELDRVEGSFKYYDAVLSKDGKEVRIHKGCIGESSGKYWGKSLEKLARKLIILDARKCMAEHNMAYYGGIVKPLERYAKEWEEAKEEVEFIESWIASLIEGRFW